MFRDYFVEGCYYAWVERADVIKEYASDGLDEVGTLLVEVRDFVSLLGVLLLA